MWRNTWTVDNMYDIKQSEYGGDEVEFSTKVYVKAVVTLC